MLRMGACQDWSISLNTAASVGGTVLIFIEGTMNQVLHQRELYDEKTLLLGVTGVIAVLEQK